MWLLVSVGSVTGERVARNTVSRADVRLTQVAWRGRAIRVYRVEPLEYPALPLEKARRNARFPERPKGSDCKSDARASGVRIPHLARSIREHTN